MALKSLFHLPLNLLLKASSTPLSFLQFSSLLLITMLFFEIVIDLTVDFESMANHFHLFLKIVLYFLILIPNSVFLAIYNLYPSTLSNFMRKYYFCPVFASFLMAILFLRLFLTANLYELIPFCLSTRSIYTMYILLTTSPKIRLLLVFIHEIVLILILAIAGTPVLSCNLKLLINLFITLAIFRKSSLFLLQGKIVKTLTETKKSSSKFDFNLPIHQNDWKGLIGDIPQGILLISLQKNVIYLNPFSIDLLDLDSFSMSSKATVYQNIVKKFGKLEETQNFPENTEDVKFAETGFTINESCRKHNMKKSFLGVNPVNIFSSQNITIPPKFVISTSRLKTEKQVDENELLTSISPKSIRKEAVNFNCLSSFGGNLASYLKKEQSA